MNNVSCVRTFDGYNATILAYGQVILKYIIFLHSIIIQVYAFSALASLVVIRKGICRKCLKLNRGKILPPFLHALDLSFILSVQILLYFTVHLEL